MRWVRVYENWTRLHFHFDLIRIRPKRICQLCFQKASTMHSQLFGWWIVVEYCVAGQLPMGCLQFNQLQQCATNGRCWCACIQEGISYRWQETFQLLRQMQFQIASNACQYEKQTFDLWSNKMEEHSREPNINKESNCNRFIYLR